MRRQGRLPGRRWRLGRRWRAGRLGRRLGRWWRRGGLGGGGLCGDGNMGGGGEGDLQRGPQSVQSVPNSQYEEYSWPNPPSSHVLSREKLHVSLQLQPIGCLGGGGFGGGGGGHGGGDGGFGGDGGEGGGGGRGYTNVCPLQLVGCSVSSSGTQAYRQRSIRTARRCASATRAIEPTPSSSKKRPKGLWPPKYAKGGAVSCDFAFKPFKVNATCPPIFSLGVTLPLRFHS